MSEEKARLEAEAEAKRKAEEERAARDAEANRSPRANIILVKGAVAPTEEGFVYPPEGNPIMLPRLADQEAGFYHPDAARIITLYPDRYKAVVSKGGKA